MHLTGRCAYQTNTHQQCRRHRQLTADLRLRARSAIASRPWMTGRSFDAQVPRQVRGYFFRLSYNQELHPVPYLLQ